MKALGEQPRIEDGGVAWRGDLRSIIRANLWLRCASRVLLRFAAFRATAFFELEKRAKRLPWAEFLAPNEAADFRVTAHKSRLYHSDAIAERLFTASRARAARGGQLFVVRVVRDEFTISADTSGELLHMRGYRQETGRAPLRETLGAALLVGAGWAGTTPLVDPFCGSGTIPIEGALIARRIPPGLNRDFAFTRWPSFDARVQSDLADEARSRMLAASPVPIAGSDRDAGAIAAAMSNAGRAGVASDVAFVRRAISDAEPPSGDAGLVATNPPYGVRVGDERQLRDLYARLGQVIRGRFTGWDLAMYSPRRALASHVGIAMEPLFATSNGGIRVSALASASGRILH